jgi:cyclic pyranopterin phosphate synthase
VSRVQSLKDAGLKRISVSLDSLDDAVFKKMNDADFPVASVLEWIEASEKAGLGPVKVNMVVRRGVNEQSILPMARYFREHGQIVRFIEYMDVGHSNGWRLDEVVSAKEIRDIIHAEVPIRPVKPNYRGEVANRYRYVDGSGEIGIIASVSQPFCGDCNRARISADGRLFTCLFAINGTDLRSMLRNGADDESIRNAITQVWQKRVDRYSELRSSQTSDLPKVEMSYIGG